MRKLTPLITCVILLACTASSQAIVGGKAASRPYPHMGALYNDGSFYCGSSLVRENWVLTAAHCVEGEDPLKYTVQLGTTLRSQGGEKLAVVQGIVHEDYNPQTAQNDLALLRLARPVAYAPIRMAGADDAALYAPGVQVTATGWGATNPNTGGSTDDLREVQVPIRSESDCDFNSTLAGSYDSQVMMCAGETTGGEDTCFGDSGGPLMDTGGGALTLVGVTSFGFECGYPLTYGVYARMMNLRAWADSKLPAKAGDPAPAPTATPDPGGDPGNPSDPGGGEDRRVRIFLPSTLGKAGKARRSGRVRFALRASGPVHAVKITLKRGTRLLGRVTVGRIVGQRVVSLRVRKARVRKGATRLTVSARDGSGRRVTAAGRPRLR